MKLLFLGNSSEVYGDIPEAQRRSSQAGLALERAFGEPVEVAVRGIWPTPGLPRLIDEWIEAAEPDIVYLNAIAYWFNYQSVPLKFERVFGRLGSPLKAAGIKAAQTPWLGHRRAFHWTRARLQKAIGGATFFSPEEVVAVMSDCIRTAVRHEDTVLVVKGPRSSGDYSPNRQWAEDRRLTVHRALRAFCAELHLDYVGVETPRFLTDPSPDLLGDRLHSGVAGHARSGDEIAGILKTAWDRHRALARGN